MREKLNFFKLSKEAKEANKGKRLVEIVLSPDPQMLLKRRCEFNLLLKEGYKYIKGKGASGGCVIVHPFRATPKAKKMASRENRKVWSWIRDQPNPERYYRYSLHFHLLTYVDNLKKPEKGEEWVYKTRRNKEGGVENYLKKSKKEEALSRLIGYLLTHAGTLRGDEEKFSSIRWFGTCSYNKFETKRYGNGEEEPRCKICGKELMPFWEWMREDYGYIRWCISNAVINPPKYWSEIEYILEWKNPPPGAEDYLV